VVSRNLPLGTEEGQKTSVKTGGIPGSQTRLEPNKPPPLPNTWVKRYRHASLRGDVQEYRGIILLPDIRTIYGTYCGREEIDLEMLTDLYF
jgi:hypothetical protein